MYEHFTPGRNIWKKVSRWMFFTMERIFVLVIVFGITYLMIKSFYPYNIGKYGLILIISNLLLAGSTTQNAYVECQGSGSALNSTFIQAANTSGSDAVFYCRVGVCDERNSWPVRHKLK